ncbi:uncharacterized protein LOC125430040 [Sphaerodactylus townsendi]|uniref:uncharacterized protein LOC125430040 n=1 Tax=Sphaerodactylus townsendi TaxID=933632 RepID=UPI0020268C15|nr:uncharacterized protein LOC125430040 [Sphaerodactylus townsendi]XP_048347673.1 uncharacterized protein LOC125430040 [Sphaerodactylus townsendi]
MGELSRMGELSLTSLLYLRSKVRPSGELFSCLDLALEKLSLEPPCVTKNARLTIAANQTLKEWSSGEGNFEIVIFHSQGKPHYYTYATTWEQYRSCLCSQTYPLTLGDLLCTRSKLRLWSSSESLSLTCFDQAVKRFSMEPKVVKQDARMLVECDGQVVEFISGQGSCEISVFLSADDVPEYDVQVKSWNVFLERLRAGIVPLNLGNIKLVKDTLESWKEEISRCFDVAWSAFIKEPRCIQENARMVVVADGERIELVSGKGENQIMLISFENRVQYQVSTRGWWELILRRLHQAKAE